MKRNVAVFVSALSLIFSVGCAPQEKWPLDDVRDEVLQAFFTPKAVNAIGNVPMYMGEIGEGWALSVGNDWGSRLLAWAYGYGNERQVLMPYYGELPREPWVDFLTFHEYIHQADYEGLLSRELFASRFEQMRNDPSFAHVAVDVDNFLAGLTEEDSLGNLVYSYDNGLTREAMAYLIQFWADGCFDLPDYMLDVYDGVVQRTLPTRTDDVDDCYYLWFFAKNKSLHPFCSGTHSCESSLITSK